MIRLTLKPKTQLILLLDNSTHIEVQHNDASCNTFYLLDLTTIHLFYLPIWELLGGITFFSIYCSILVIYFLNLLETKIDAKGGD